ncbi:MAG: hydrogenase expression protein HupH [Nitrososphaerota archaeon]|nr:hydrogenase expression protein HupH [Nitrososphaerota archaeon]
MNERVFKLLYAVPGVGLDKAELKRRERILNSIASEGTNVEVRAVTEGPESIESVYDEFMCVPPTTKLIQEAERSFDGVIIGCYGDPGIEAIRETVRIPVVGPGESSMLFASLVGRRFSVVTIAKSVFPMIEGVAERVGVASKLISIRETEMRVLDVGVDVERSKRKIEDASVKAIREDGADTIILGCMSEAFLGFDKELSKSLGVPVINPVATAVKVAEGLMSSGLTHSKLAYPSRGELVRN